MFWQRVVTSSLLATGVQAGIGSLVMDGMTRGSPSVERRMEEIAKASLRSRGYVAARQSIQNTTGPASNVLLNQDGTIDMTAWDTLVNGACDAALSHLAAATNPAGTCICYNLPALDNVTGTFEADLRLYQVSQPTGQFAAIPQQNIQVGLSYQGASVSPVSATTASQKVVAKVVAARQDAAAAQQNSTLKPLQTYLFVGQIDTNKMTAPLTMAELEALVMPIVTLTAVDAAGQTVSTNVSANEAAFVAGVFSQSTSVSDFGLALLAVQDEVAGLRNGTVAFVLPGVQIMVFPVGLVITSVWLAIGVAAYGYGTVQRIAFREQYRRRAQRAVKGSIGRI